MWLGVAFDTIEVISLVPTTSSRLIPSATELKVGGVVTGFQLLIGSAFVAPLIGWAMILAACVLIGLSLGAIRDPGHGPEGLHEYRQ